jgi:hypothetical protein
MGKPRRSPPASGYPARSKDIVTSRHGIGGHFAAVVIATGVLLWGDGTLAYAAIDRW